MQGIQQLDHYSYANEPKKFPIEIILDQLRTPANIGMCLRIAEAFGVESIYLWEDGPQLEQRNIKKTARSVEKNLRLNYFKDLNSLIAKKKRENIKIIAIELTNQSHSLANFEFSKNEKICLILGSERQGINAEILKQTDLAIAIDMFGVNSSMNVANSLAIALYEITKQLNK